MRQETPDLIEMLRKMILIREFACFSPTIFRL